MDKPSEVGTSSDVTLVGGIKDMMGNVLEWTSSKHLLYPNHPDKLVGYNAKHFIVRGSSWGEAPDNLKNKNWLITRRQAVTADKKYPFLGFRIVCEP